MLITFYINKGLMKKITQKKALIKLLNILRKHSLIFKSTNEKIINHLLEYERINFNVMDDKGNSINIYMQVEHPGYNNLDYIYNYDCFKGTEVLQKRVSKALEEWELKTEDTCLIG